MTLSMKEQPEMLIVKNLTKTIKSAAGFFIILLLATSVVGCSASLQKGGMEMTKEISQADGEKAIPTAMT